ncbi:MAG: Clp protease ClpP [Methyloversatilis sp.]|uniref:Clp protease ClpP n=1 Tax=Methyloversatilis sp. TaxID=2569862 RepID=UPI002732C511|nr:Clp protease ClpP [Methyloversatilis sp.]MDP2868579.1 Clp protease ClpP [Methyloversatilis sp.]
MRWRTDFRPNALRASPGLGRNRRRWAHNPQRTSEELAMLHKTTAEGTEPDAPVETTAHFSGLIRYERQMPIHQISYYLCGDIGEPQHYTELFYTLRTASETDLIYLHLNSPGGEFDTGLQIINNILASEAHVITVLEARAYSMAALIFLSGDELVIHDNCQLMFHIYSGSFAGRGNEQQAEVIAVGKWFEKAMGRICTPFLSDSEIGKILKGSDLWMDSDEIQRRLMRLQRARAKSATTARKKPGTVPDGAA